MADPIVNFFKSTLVGTYSDTDTSITIATGDGALLPDPSVDGAFNLTIFEGLQVNSSTTFEIVRVTARSGDVLTVTRGQESTTPLTIGSATHSILMSATKKTFDDINTAIANVNVTTLTGVEELTFDSTGDEEFGLPAGTTAQRPSSPSAGYMRWNSTDSRVEFYNGSRWAGLSEIGLEQVDLGVAELSVTANDAVASSSALEVEALVVGGGAGGAGAIAGGGGGGTVYAVSATELDTATNYSVTVGAGGSASTSDSTPGSDGSSSVFNVTTAIGGGGGGSRASSNAGSLGTGGGAGPNGNPGGTGSVGGDGGDGQWQGGNVGTGAGGGGGGASTDGANGVQSVSGGDGGDGIQSSISGSATYYGGGGGGGGDTRAGVGTPAGSGGLGGGGNGSDTNGTAQSGTVNLGGGGGGGGLDGGVVVNGASGGSGVVILRYPSAFTISVGAGLSDNGEQTDGSFKYIEITAGTGNVSWS